MKQIKKIIELNNLDSILEKNLSNVEKLISIRDKVYSKYENRTEDDMAYYIFDKLNKRAFRYLTGHYFGMIIKSEMKTSIAASDCYVSNEDQEKLNKYNEKIISTVYKEWSEEHVKKENAFYNLYVGFAVDNNLDSNKIYIKEEVK